MPAGPGWRQPDAPQYVLLIILAGLDITSIQAKDMPSPGLVLKSLL